MSLLQYVTACAALAVVSIGLYLWRINTLMLRTPPEAEKLVGKPWTPELLKETYKRLEQQPPEFTRDLPPKLDRRYIVTGGSGLVGGWIVLHLLARGHPPSAIRILDIRKTERLDMQTGDAALVTFVETDITSAVSVEAAFSLPWDEPVSHLPLTVFHTAAVILASERAEREYWFAEAINVTGTRHVLDAARKHGASIFSYTSSASIAIKPVQPLVCPPWASAPANFFQLLDVTDHDRPLRSRGGYFANYPASKAAAERMVCDDNEDSFRTGAVRPANGVYGHPTDNMVGWNLARPVVETWVPHMIQPFVHAANVAAAHLAHEAVLSTTAPESSRFSGRPYVVTDPNPPIRNRDLYLACSTLLAQPWRVMILPPWLVVLLAHAVEKYTDAWHESAVLRKWLPPITGPVSHLMPGIFSITTHLVAVDEDARKPVSEGGLGYTGLLTTLDGIVYQILQWNREVAAVAAGGDGDGSGGVGEKRKTYTSSLSVGELLKKTGVSIAKTAVAPLSTGK